MKVDVLNTDGGSTGRQIDLSDDVFGIEPNEHCVYLAVKAYNAAQRQGTSSTKERNAVRGSTRKIKKQKGTGTARAGDIKNPIFRGGGRIFGPRPRNYKVKLNKKVKRLAKLSALSDRAGSDSIIIVEDFTMDSPKTGNFRGILENLKVYDTKTLFLTGGADENIYLSGRNIPKVKVKGAAQVNIMDVMEAERIVFTESGIEKLNEILA